ncbi:putative HTH-type transcriptional regulator YusO [Lactiplantibacillus plantarum]|uniref:MarR family transcriptional regulator n=1 Tax=Lactiplantibacillus plantarum TaxID=1590 RepID=UPI000CFA177E|nr:MarR family transcriptional regulator [Lactiplantibacillus plantarum]QYC98781.1 MarR family transcriptional regulator [Lactiplantibacillus plantarum]SPE07500.1 putative HTH-type transcriptional regulator YusO [Lactiplantibacillus plantarum]SPE12858.1 putative HTH-type transcriptional regulator YusO [Lactiplantibacillus plantarum]SPH06438.1 putative HTH-type transcriptional regulator YusO [Lactiplantibacillus plantarum]SPH09581.1 putative HTH-type transcriptional regulator YusO [Lactiplantib
MLNHQQIKTQFEALETLQSIQKQVQQMLTQGLATTGLSMREWEVLAYLDQHEQASTSELADAFKVTRTLISRNTWRLVQDNLIQPQINQADRRIVRLSLTSNGQEAIQQIARQVQVNLQDFDHNHELVTLTKQVARLKQYLAALN